MIVVDSNIIAYLYITGERTEQVERLLLCDSNWNAPLLWRSEFRNVLARYLRKGFLQLEETLLILDEAEQLMRSSEYEVNSSHVMRLVNKSECSAYDCEFVALAQYLAVPLVTADKRLLKAFPETAQSINAVVSRTK